jgi:hypothetical protein
LLPYHEETKRLARAIRAHRRELAFAGLIGGLTVLGIVLVLVAVFWIIP